MVLLFVIGVLAEFNECQYKIRYLYKSDDNIKIF